MKTELEGRTIKFAVQVVKTVGGSSKTIDGQVIGRQLLKAGTSIGANYREANRAESRVDFIHKIGIAEKRSRGNNLLVGNLPGMQAWKQRNR